MKRLTLLALLVAILGGCVVVPVGPVHPAYVHGYVGYGYHSYDHGWYRYNRGAYHY